ncbi:MAG: Fic family protein [Gammaproteobacteria bacterium]
MHINEIRWIWQQPTWPAFTWQNETIEPLLQAIQLKQGILLGKANASGESSNFDTELDMLVQNIITSSAIEGEQLNAASIRSSLAKRLGVRVEHPYPVSDRSEGLAKMMFDAIEHIDLPMTLERLFQWHRWIFPADMFTLHNVRIGELRGNEPMQVVSGRIDKPKIHYEAPPRDILEHELNVFIEWFNQSRQEPLLDPMLRAAICHLWFVVIHPFEDGNGRITRALTDLALAQANPASIRLYAMSPAILANRSGYYLALENSKQMDITPWLVWFLNTLSAALQASLDNIEHVVVKTRFWQRFQETDLSAEQRKVLQRLLDGGEKGFEHGISASQYQKVAKVSKATATRHLADLLEKGCIEKLPGGGRNTRYQVRII